jgi:exodeoxyribonuclease VII large subunit
VSLLVLAPRWAIPGPGKKDGIIGFGHLSVNGALVPDIYSVTRLNQEARALLENGLPGIWIEGELSNLARPASGHVYFSLKDPSAQVRCAMFRARLAQMRFVPENGTHVLLHARVSLFEARGEFQLIVDQMEPAGAGLLQLAFERLKQRLHAEGLFDSVHKKSIPRWPKRIGVITSPSGAAVRDVLSVLRRRCQMLPVIIYPTAVQGERAAGEIVAAIRTANKRAECDVLIIARGGGSIEDLWPFNEEQVARAVFASTIPIVSGIGHEIDFTITDLVADVRAPTPSAAAELVAPEMDAVIRNLSVLSDRLQRLLRMRLDRLSEIVDWCERRLRHPGRLLSERKATLQRLHQRLPLAFAGVLQHRGVRLAELRGRLFAQQPGTRLQALQVRYSQLAIRLQNAWHHGQRSRHAELMTLTRALKSISPLATLDRGYAIVRNRATGAIARSASQFHTGDRVIAQLHDGSLDLIVDATHEQRLPT